MSLEIYLDDCAYAKVLVSLLRTAGHRVSTPVDANTLGRGDEEHLDYAAQHSLVLLTRDADDFRVLHEANQDHAGILAIYQDNDPSRDMNYAEIVKAIANLENTGIPIRGAYHVLNAWRF